MIDHPLSTGRCLVFVVLCSTAPLALAAIAPGESPRPGETLRDTLPDGTPGPEMVVIPPGSFVIGSPLNEAGRNVDEGPQRTITFSEPFALGRTEVTVAEFERFVAATGHVTDAERDGGCYVHTDRWETVTGTDWRDPPGFEQTPDHPVICVSWNDARAYAKWLSVRTGQRYRLPTEAEWEYAARAGVGDPWFWGDDPDAACRYANVADRDTKDRYPGDWPHHDCRSGHAHTAPVGEFQPNRFGLRDTTGNVWEWTCSAYQLSYRGAEQVCAEPGDPEARVFRGGSWYNFPEWTRTAARSAFTAEFRGIILGLRLLRELD